jgi:hypothetical protein
MGMAGRVEAWQKHAFRPISAGFAAIQLGIQGLDQLILHSIFTNFSTSARQYKAHLRIRRSAHYSSFWGKNSVITEALKSKFI